MTDPLSLVDALGTPVYVYDLAEIRTNHRRLRAALPERAVLYYALAANPHPELLREIRAADVLPAVCSPGELDAALVAGWPAHEIVYSGPARRDADLDWALRLGVRTFTVDSSAALAQLARRAAEHRESVDCLLRVNACGFIPAGADPHVVLAEPFRFTGGTGARVIGLRLCADSDSDIEAAAELADRLSSALTEQGVPVERVTFAGFAPGSAGVLAGRLRVAFEVDGDLVGTAGTLLTSVLDVRATGERQEVVLESGANHVGLFAGRRRRSLVPQLISRPLSGEPVDTVLIGPQETPFDVWATPVRLPLLRVGDVLVVPDTGAWGVTAGLVAFGASTMPAEVVVDRDDSSTDVVHVSRLSVTRYP